MSRLGGSVVVALGAWAAVAPCLSGAMAPRELVAGALVSTLLPALAAVAGGLVLLAGGRRAASAGGVLALGAGLWFVAEALAGVFTAGGTPALQWTVFFSASGVMIGLLGAHGLGLLGGLVHPRPLAPRHAGARGARVPLTCQRRRRPGAVTHLAADRQPYRVRPRRVWRDA